MIGPRRKPIEPHFSVYRLYDAQATLLYVGLSSCSWKSRLHHHRRTSWGDRIRYVEVEEYTSWLGAQQMEYEAIVDQRPPWNRQIPAQAPVESFKAWLKAGGPHTDWRKRDAAKSLRNLVQARTVSRRFFERV